MDQWLDTSSAWWAKCDRADRRLRDLDEMLAEFRASDPYMVQAEPTEVPDRIAYRLHIRRQPPVEVSTVTGDVLHNLRSALDSLAFAVAEETVRRTRGRVLCKAEEHAAAFPISKTPDAFDAFFARPPRNQMYDGAARSAGREVQPFRVHERVQRASDEQRQERYGESYRWEALPRLRHLHNLDKHRRLAVTAWWPQMVWWSGSEGADGRLLPGDGTLLDGSVLWYFQGEDAGGSDLHHEEFAVVLTDDQVHQPGTDPDYEPEDCVELLRGWHREVAHTVRSVIQTYIHESSDGRH